ncbi:MAG: type 4a pilus biogenesis protein PilO [bacterium]|jgi:Tfp pilus assembly protein PilO|nr:type 4a pilus biogenesis protein PilO [bacterium]
MKRNITGYVLLLAFAIAMSYAFSTIVIAKPQRITELEAQLKFEQEKLISAQILASELVSVSSMIEKNLAGSTRDGLTEEASLDFLNTIIVRLSELGCEITDLKALPREKNITDYIRTPYQVSFRGTYAQFGRFLSEMEKDSRLVTVEFLKIDNDLTQLNFARTFDDLKTHNFIVKFSTLTLVRSDQDTDAVAKGGPGATTANTGNAAVLAGEDGQ